MTVLVPAIAISLVAAITLWGETQPRVGAIRELAAADPSGDGDQATADHVLRPAHVLLTLEVACAGGLSPQQRAAAIARLEARVRGVIRRSEIFSSTGAQ